MPGVVAVGEHRALGGEQVERREAKVVDAVRRAARSAGRRRGSGRHAASRARSVAISSPTSRPRAAAWSSVASVAVRPAWAAAPTAAYWRRTRSIALADQGSSSQSSASQPGRELVPQTGGVGRGADARERRLGVGVAVKERAAGAGVDHPGLSGVDTETVAGDLLVAADDHDRAGAHVLLLADHLADAVAAVLGERVLGVLEQVGPLGGRRWAPSSAAGRSASAGRSRSGS